MYIVENQAFTYFVKNTSISGKIMGSLSCPIPVVDLQELTSEERIELDLDKGLRSHGCVYLTNTGIPERVIEDMFLKSRDFFQLPSSTKMLYGKGEDYYGGYYVSTQQSLRERYDIMLSPSVTPLPENAVRGFTSAFHAYKQAMDSVARFVLMQIASALGLPPYELLQHHQGALGGGSGDDDDLERTKAHFTSLYYSEEEEEMVNGDDCIMGTHTDFSTLTLLLSSAPGIQVQMPEGWINADPLDGCIFLHVGDLLERWTGGTYRATVHRVKRLGSSAAGRQSIPYFIHPDVDALVEPLIPGMTGLLDDDYHYPPIRAGDYWKAKMEMRRKQK